MCAAPFLYIMSDSQRYRRILIGLLEQLEKTQAESIGSAAKAVADCLQGDGLVYLLGSGHSLLSAYEVHNRAGGLAPVEVILDPGFGRAERVSGYARTLMDHADPEPGSVLFVISNSGRNPLPVEMAMLGKERGMKTIAITSLAHSHAVTSRHPSGKRLFELADIVIDNCGEAGDACLEVPGVDGRMGATSSVTAIAIVNSIMIDAAAELARRGFSPPVLISANLDGADDHNRALYERYRGRIRWL